MAAHTQRSRVVRWETPFADKAFPAVTPIIDHETDVVTVVVMPDGLGKYPGYLVRFSAPALLMTYEETNAPIDPEWVAAGGHDLKHSASYKWEGSPLAVRNKRLGRKAVFEGASIQHYVIAGGDYIVEVLAPAEPVITRFDAPQSIVVKYEF